MSCSAKDGLAFPAAAAMGRPTGQSRHPFGKFKILNYRTGGVPALVPPSGQAVVAGVGRGTSG